MTQDASEAEDDVITHFALIQLSVLLLNKLWIRKFILNCKFCFQMNFYLQLDL